MSRTDHTLIVGTRGSLLARSQTQWVIDRIRAAHPGLDIQTEIITTKGDREQGKPLPEVGAKGIFTIDLEAALTDGRIDIAVHSAKDLQAELTPGLEVLCYPVREDPRDAWISPTGTPFEELPPGSVVGTSSLRRQAQLLAIRPDLKFIPLRGNIDTRINKTQRGDCAGAVLALAGLRRAKLDGHMTHPFEPEVCLPAPAQGALAIEGRADDARVRAILAAIHDPATATAVECERAILAELDAGCRAPIGILARVEGDRLRCDARVIDPAGTRQVRASVDVPLADRDSAPQHILEQLRAGGAEAIIAACRV